MCTLVNKGFDEDQIYNAKATHDSVVNCDSCPSDVTGEGCLVCIDGGFSIAAGFTTPSLATTSSDADLAYVFRCHHNIDVAKKRCPGGQTEFRRSLRADQLALANGCAEGYKGQLCGECAEDFGMSTANVCEPCGENTTAAVIGIFFASLAAIAGLLTLIGKLWSRFPLKHLLRCSVQPLRILITYSQVTSQLGDVLDIQYPNIFGSVIEFLKPFMDVFSLLFRAVGPSECFGIQGFNSRWFLRVIGLPAVLSVFVGIAFVWDRYVSRPPNPHAAVNLKSNCFFAIFFCYPTICVISFAAFICQVRPL